VILLFSKDLNSWKLFFLKRLYSFPNNDWSLIEQYHSVGMSVIILYMLQDNALYIWKVAPCTSTFYIWWHSNCLQNLVVDLFSLKLSPGFFLEAIWVYLNVVGTLITSHTIPRLLFNISMILRIDYYINFRTP